MTLAELAVAAYGWLDRNAVLVLGVCVAGPLLGLLAAWIGRGGKTDRDGRLLANLVLGFGFLAFVLELIGLGIAHWGFGQGLLAANVLLLLAPPVALALGLFGVRKIFPLSELASATAARDVGLFALGLLVLFWLFGQFRGWGIVFVGGLVQMAVIGILLLLFVRYLYRRAF